MIRVTVLYPSGEGNTFDMEYYKTTHKEIVFKALQGVEHMEIVQGIDGPYMAMGHLHFPSAEAMQAAMASPAAGEAQEDVKNFTNVQPQIQVSLVVD
jgi:uncharacterized protein (TIGR02118 family)